MEANREQFEKYVEAAVSDWGIATVEGDSIMAIFSKILGAGL